MALMKRLILAAGPVAIAGGALDYVIRYANSRLQFNKTIGEQDLIVAKIANILSQLASVKTNLYTQARKI